MALTEGTNCGFVTTAPTADPTGTGTRTIDNYKRSTQDTTPSSPLTVTEVGWWCDNATDAGTFEMGIYTDSGGAPSDRLYVSTGNAKGTTAGWKVISGLSWTLEASTTYWIALALTDTTTATNIDYGTGTQYAYQSGETTLPDPYGSTSYSSGQCLAIYALLEAGTTYALSGYTKDNDGNILGGCECYLLKDNGGSFSFDGYQSSDISTGYYSFSGLDNSAIYQVVAWKDDTPHVYDVTDWILQPQEE